MSALVHGPLAPLFEDPRVTEILVNGPDAVYAEVGGRLQRADVAFRDAAELRQTVVRLVGLCGRRIDDATPLVDARLPDGSRLNAVLPPLAVDGPLLTIRRFGVRRLTIEDLLQLGSLLPDQAAVLRAVVDARLNVLISGGTSSGKTTLLAAIVGLIDPAERIVSVEDAAELALPIPHIARLEARPASVEGRGAIDVRALVRNALRMRPDRLVVGEVRGGEALDLLLALNTGHDGSLATVHANGPADALRRLETMALMAGVDLPHGAIRESIATAVHVVVHVERRADGRRVVAEIAAVEVAGDGWRVAGADAVPPAPPGGGAVPERSLVGSAFDRRFGARRRRESQLAVQLPEAARAIARSYAAGLPFGTACRRAADSLDDPAASILRTAGLEAERGRVPADTLFALADAPGGGLIRGAIAVNAELGGDLVSALEALADGLDDRERLRGEIAVATAQARFAARVVPAVPLLALGLLGALSPAAVAPLVDDAARVGCWSSSARCSTSRRSAAAPDRPRGGAVSGLLLVLAAALLGAAAMPRFLAGARARRAAVARARALRRELPDALELLAAAIDGGAPVERALSAVAAHIASRCPASCAGRPRRTPPSARGSCWRARRRCGRWVRWCPRRRTSASRWRARCAASLVTSASGGVATSACAPRRPGRG